MSLELQPCVATFLVSSFFAYVDGLFLLHLFPKIGIATR